ncbi:hypothetical protein MPCS_00119 [Candidatus Megaera polyxenophila]|nr:hypothetical protein MPCS_00119 [Candidatus Megaera polyxenophila]
MIVALNQKYLEERGGQMNNQDVAQFYFKEINNLDRFNE